MKVGHHPVTVEEDDDLLARESFSILVVLILGSVILFSMLGIGRPATLASPDSGIFTLNTAEILLSYNGMFRHHYWALFLCSV